MDGPAAARPADADESRGRSAFRGGDWSSYWCNGYIYESDARRGLYIWEVNAPEVNRGQQPRLES